MLQHATLPMGEAENQQKSRQYYQTLKSFNNEKDQTDGNKNFPKSTKTNQRRIRRRGLWQTQMQ
jgi:hypothetical protein